jgi:hypothetical protein
MRRVVLLFAALLLHTACSLDPDGLDGTGSPDARVADAPGMDASLRDSGSMDSQPPSDRGSPRMDANVDSSSHPDSGVKDSAPDDSTKDTSPPPMDAADSSVPDSGSLFLCGSSMVDNCAACSGNIVGCLYCNGGGTPYGFCIAVGQACKDHRPTGAPLDASACTCAYPSASACIAPDQVCYNLGGGYCLTCGQSGTDTLACMGGGDCNESTATCE